MNDGADREDWRKQNISDWLLALLQFAVTLQEIDKSAVLTIAEGIDHLGSEGEEQSSFGFFRRTSAEVCGAVTDQNDPRRLAILRQHLKRIDDHRTRRAFEAVVESEETRPRAIQAPKQARPIREDLWRGLPRRGS